MTKQSGEKADAQYLVNNKDLKQHLTSSSSFIHPDKKWEKIVRDDLKIKGKGSLIAHVTNPKRLNL